MPKPHHPSLVQAARVARDAASRVTDVEAKTDYITVSGSINLDSIKTDVDALPANIGTRLAALEAKTHTVVLCSFEPDATTPTIQSEIGISTVARLGTGRYRLTYDTAFADTDYIITSGCGDSGGRDYYVVLVKYTGYVDVAVMYAPSDVWSDGADSVSIAIWNP